jgi:hypothetical protein
MVRGDWLAQGARRVAWTIESRCRLVGTSLTAHSTPCDRCSLRRGIEWLLLAQPPPVRLRPISILNRLSAQLRRLRRQSATTASRRNQPSGEYLVVPVPQGREGTLTPIIASRVTNFASRSSSHPSVPAGRRGNTR